MSTIADEPAAETSADQNKLQREVVKRLGLLPNAFRPPEGAPEVAEGLWAFAKGAYIDNPLPALFKERLFVHLSRFCPWRYCIGRHVGFLLGRGHAGGDPTAQQQSVEQVTALLSGPGRLKGEELKAALSRLRAAPGLIVPNPQSRAEADLFAAATELFLEPDRSRCAQEALTVFLGSRNLGFLATFLAFIRAFHYWTSMGRITLEEDVEALLRDHESLACLLQQPEAQTSEITERLQDEISHLRGERDEQRAEAARKAEMLRLALDSADQGAWAYEVAADRPVWDAKTCALYGQPVGTPLSLDDILNRFVHPEDRESADRAARAAFDPSGDGRLSLEHRVIWPNGETRWLSINGRALFEGHERERHPLRLLGTVRDITAAKQREEELRESEKRFRAIADYTYEWGTWIGPDGRPIWISPAVARITGRSVEDCIAMPDYPLPLIHGDDRDRMRRHLREALAGGAGNDIAFRIVKADGHIVWGSASWQPIVGAQKAAQGYRMSVREITERIKAEEALRQRERRLKAVLRAADLGSWHWNLQDDHGDINPRYAQMLGYNRGELNLNFQTFIDMVHPDDVKRVRAALREHFKNRTNLYSIEIRMRHRDGHWVWVLASGRLIQRDSDGRPLIMTGIHQDITERVMATLALEESEIRFRDTFENAAVGIAHIGLDGHWLRVNGRLCQIVGYGREELLTKTFQEMSYPDDINPDLDRFNAMMRGDIPGYQIQKRFLRKGGEIVWTNVTTSLQRDKEGAPLYSISILEDITERKHAEENRQLLMNELNHRVKNTLAIVQSIAHQTFKHAGDDGRALTRTFQNRLAALASAHDLLTRSNWQSASLKDLAQEALKGCCADADIHLEGPQVMLQPKQSVTFAMAFHELGTNATKYGALSGGSGRIDVTWNIADDGHGNRLELVWRERGGPCVKWPRQRGFGSRMIEQALASELEGTVHMDFRPDGLVCTIEGRLDPCDRSFT